MTGSRRLVSKWRGLSWSGGVTDIIAQIVSKVTRSMKTRGAFSGALLGSVCGTVTGYSRDIIDSFGLSERTSKNDNSVPQYPSSRQRF